MALNWKQEPRFAAEVEPGHFYRVFPVAAHKFAASFAYLDESGNMVTSPIESGVFDSAELARAACEKDAAGKTRKAA